MSKTIEEKADFAAKQVVRALTGLADNKTCIQATRESYNDWYDMFYELLADTIDYEEYKAV